MEIRELREQAQRVYHEMRAILDAADAEQRGLTAEESERYDRLDEELGNLLEEIERRERMERVARHLDTIVRDAVPAVRQEYNDVERAFETYLRRGERSLGEHEVRALSSITGSLGGYLVPQTWARELIQIITQYSAIRQVASVIRTDSGEPILYPIVDDTAVEGALVAENAASPTADVTFDQKRLDVHLFSAKVTEVPLQLLQDSAYQVDRLLIQLFGERLGRVTERHYVTGTGLNQPQGILEAPVGHTASSATTITFDDILSLIHSVDPAYRQNGVFVLNDATLLAIRKLKDATNQPLWQLSYREGEPNRILGYPYVVSPYMPTIAANAKVIAFGDFRSAYVIRDVNGIEVVRSDRNLVDRYQMQFNAWLRSGGIIVNTRAIRLLQMGA
jgi:HK97 family phage major capsid protein